MLSNLLQRWFPKRTVAVSENYLPVIPFEGFDGGLDLERRTEDVRFSPSGRRLCMVSTNGHLLALDLDITSNPIRIERWAEFKSDALLMPHGLDFLDEDKLVIANRAGVVAVFNVPPADTWSAGMTLQPVHEMTSTWFGEKGATRLFEKRHIRCGPGSVRLAGDRLYVCCNNRATLTAHAFRFNGADIVIDEGINHFPDAFGLPDGIAVSRNLRFLAVSDHAKNCISVFSLAGHQHIATLRDPELAHPHGLCFDATGTMLYAADAGSRLLHIFNFSGDAWKGEINQASARIMAVDDWAYRKTRGSVLEAYRSLEGGIKGIDLDPTGKIIATTCQNQLLRFFSATPART